MECYFLGFPRDTRPIGTLPSVQGSYAPPVVSPSPFVVQSEGDTWVIAPPVLKAFDKLTKATVVWVRGGQYWRTRELGDPPRAREVDW